MRISSLPPEILTNEIFLTYIAAARLDRNSNLALLRLRRTSSEWNALVLSSAILWNHIIIPQKQGNHVALVTSAIKNSGSLPLNIDIHYNEESVRYSLPRIVDMLVSQASRLKSLHLYTPGFFDPALQPLFSVPQYPLLSEVGFTSRVPVGDEFPCSFSGALPNLRSIMMSSGNLRGSSYFTLQSMYAHTLTLLAVSNLKPRCIELFRQFPNLRRLSLYGLKFENSEPSNSSPSSSSSIIVLASVKSLTIEIQYGSEYEHPNHFVQQLSFPNLEELHFRNNPVHLSALFPNNKVFENLTTLKFEELEEDIEYMDVGFLSRQPVKCLIVNEADIEAIFRRMQVDFYTKWIEEQERKGTLTLSHRPEEESDFSSSSFALDVYKEDTVWPFLHTIIGHAWDVCVVAWLINFTLTRSSIKTFELSSDCSEHSAEALSPGLTEDRSFYVPHDWEEIMKRRGVTVRTRPLMDF